ncbi:MAG: alpha/beta hydrolase [Anaerolineales bacterium]|nr:alpha/beta hydrolase [Anaerolineales bacterium]
MTSLQSKLMRLYVRYIASKSDPDRSVLDQRAKLEKDAEGIVRMPRGVSVRSLQAGNVAAEWLEPDAARKGTTILYLHGGSYIVGSPRTHRGLAGSIALAGRSPALVVDYRLAPENPFPAALDDTLSAYAWLREQRFAPEHIVIGGDSAGGGLTIAAAVALRERGISLPAALFCLSPWTDLTGSGETIRTRAAADPWLKASEMPAEAKKYSGQNAPDHPLISPLFADLRGLPPTLIHVGDDEILLSDSTRLEEKMRAAGVDVTLEIWPGMWHVWHAFAPYLPEARRAIERIGAFILKHT